MITQQIRKQLDTIKIHIDELESWIKNATDMIYQVEEKIFDIEDDIYNAKEYSLKKGLLEVKEAASGIYQTMECPPRLNPIRCSKENTAAAGFNQLKISLNYLFNQQETE